VYPVTSTLSTLDPQVDSVFFQAPWSIFQSISFNEKVSLYHKGIVKLFRFGPCDGYYSLFLFDDIAMKTKDGEGVIVNYHTIWNFSRQSDLFALDTVIRQLVKKILGLAIPLTI
jgi:hypothetical protein